MDVAGAIERVRSPFDLPTYQKRIRHLKSISVRNLQCASFKGDDVSLMETFFTLHKDRKSQAVYTSEKIKGSMNPTWRNFDTRYFEDKLDTISKFIVIKIWIQFKSDLKVLVDLEVNLDALMFLTDRLQMEGMKYRSNSVIFGMFDKYFIEPTIPVYNPEDENLIIIKMLHVYQANQRPSYNSNSLSRVHTILRAIKQTQASVSRLHQHIEDKLLSALHIQSKVADREELLLKTNQLHSELEWKTTKLQSNKNKYDDKRESIRNRYERLKERRLELRGDRGKQEEERQTYNQHREKWIKESAQLLIRRKQLIGELSTSVFPVSESEKGDFYICKIKLPNSESYQGHDELMVAVALGYTCHLTLMIAQILNLPLRYIIEFRGSRSQIRDHIHIKLTEKDRDFPLYSKGKEKFQFNYGVYLLNKNISQLRFYCGLGTSDLRVTLPNIKSLLELRLGVRGDYSMSRSVSVPATVGGGGVGNSMNSHPKDFGTRSTAGSSSASSSAKQEQTALLQSLDMEISELQIQGDLNCLMHSDKKSSSIQNIDETEELFAKSEDSFFKFPKPANSSSDFKIAQCDDVIDAINIKANFKLKNESNANGVSVTVSDDSMLNCDILDNSSHNSSGSLQNGDLTSEKLKNSDSTSDILLVSSSAPEFRREEK